MKLLLLVILALLSTLETASASVMTNTTCEVGNSRISDPANCSVNPPGSFPSANANITIKQFSPAAGQDSLTTFLIDVAGSAQAHAGLLSPLVGINSGVTATANMTNQFFTAGPIRQGVIRFSSFSTIDFDPGFDFDTATVTVGSLQGSCAGHSFLSGSCTGLLAGPALRSLSFTLGDTFAVNFTESFTADADISDGAAGARGEVNFNFQLFEADGTTPVTIYVAPEPGTFALLLVSLTALGATYGFRAGRRSSAASILSPKPNTRALTGPAKETDVSVRAACPRPCGGLRGRLP